MTRPRPGPVLSVVAVFAVWVALVVALGGGSQRVATDESLFQLPTVRQFARQWPRPDLTDYPTSSSPGYHLVLAAVSHYASDSTAVLRSVGGVFGFLLIGLAAWAAGRRSAWLALPLAASSYVLTSTAYVLPENAAWALTLAAWLLCLRAEGRTLLIGSAVTLAVLVFVRQSNAWVLGVFAVTALWRYARPLRPARLAASAAALVPAVLVLGTLVVLWHGLSPPAFQPNTPTSLPESTKSGGLTLGAPMTTLVLLGVFGTPLLAWLWPAGGRRAAAVGGVIGGVLGAVPASFYVQKERAGGFWNVVHHLPTVAGRSPLVIGLAVLGGGGAAVALHALRGRDRWVMAAALVGFVLAQSATPLLWQRYYEPFVLLWLLLAAAAVETPAGETPVRRAFRYGGVAGLVVFQIAVTAVTLRGGTGG